VSFSSSDFDKTKPALGVDVPERLLHPAVRETGQRAGFSAERKHGVAVVDLPTKTLSVTLGELEPGQSTNRHRHNYETVLYILEGSGYTVVEDRQVHWKKGDAVYVPVWAWHNHVNNDLTQPASYLACENAPLLQNLGGIALREEGH
jgi:gentisate 1,2-dioxygenase